MFRSLTLVSLLALAKVALSTPCVTFDANFNMLVFGLGGKDWNAGTQDSWTSGSATDITTTGRPPFDGDNTTCYLTQFFNAVYVMNGDASNPSAVHIYDAAAKSWSTQSVTTGTFDPKSFKAILDHDTNVFYALSHNELFFLDFDSMKVANSTALSWVDVGKAPFESSYDPVMALAQNHIHFLDVPGTPAGSANIFVIHYSYWQPETQAYPNADGNSFPASHGQTTSFFQESGVQQEFAFIPDDGSATYVINVENNSTTTLAAPSTKDSKATYAASITALVQLDSKGALSFLPYTQGQADINAKAAWTSVANVAAVVPPGSGTSATPSASGSSTATASKSGSTTTGSGTAKAAAASTTTGTTTGSNGALTTGPLSLGVIGAGLLSTLALLL